MDIFKKLKKMLIEAITNKTAFKIFYVTFVAINLISIINIQPFTRIFLVISAIWGATIILHEIFHKKMNNYKNIITIMIAFIVICTISYLINFKSGGMNKIIALGFSSLCVLVLFSDGSKKINNLKNEIYYLNLSFSIITFFANIISLIYFVSLTNFQIIGRGTAIIRLGFLENRLFGVFSSANVGGSYSFVAISMMIINLFFLGKKIPKWQKIFYYINIALCYIYISLSLSRGTYISTCAFIATVLILIKLPEKISKKMFDKKAILFRIGSITVMLLMFFTGMQVIRLGMSYVPILYKNITSISNVPTIDSQNNTLSKAIGQNQNASKVPGDNVKPTLTDQINKSQTVSSDVSNPGQIQFQRIEGDRKGVTNGRVDIWESSLKLMKGKYLFGVGSSRINIKDPVYAKSSVLNKHDLFVLEKTGGNVQNGYFQIFVECGAIALLLFLTFIVAFLVKVLKNLKRIHHNKSIYQLSVMILAFLIYFFVNNIPESNIMLMGANTFQAVFWIFAGYLYTLVTHSKTEPIMEGEQI